jgi:hypothetical protein
MRRRNQFVGFQALVMFRDMIGSFLLSFGPWPARVLGKAIGAMLAELFGQGVCYY